MADSPSLADTFGSTSSGLIDRVKAHEAEAWRRLVNLYSPLVFHWCRAAQVDADDAADVLQEVFQSVASAIERFRYDSDGHTFRGWLRTITRNKLRDYYRRQLHTLEATGGSEAQHQLMQVAQELSDDWQPSSEPDERLLLFRQSLELLRQEFEPATWQAFWRVTIDEHEPARVAADLGVSLNAVYKAKSRVLGRLRSELGMLLD